MSDDSGVLVLGAGGHAKVVISALRAAGLTVEALLDDDPARHGDRLLGVPVVGAIGSPEGEERRRAVCAIGDNRRRRERIAGLGLEWVSVVHPTAWLDATVRLGAGSVVFAGAVIQPDTVIGRHVIVNTGASVDHDCAIDDFAHVAPGCHLGGGVSVGEGALLGIGSVAKPGVTIGAWAVVGAGGVVVGDVPEGAVVSGVPAR